MYVFILIEQLNPSIYIIIIQVSITKRKMNIMSTLVKCEYDEIMFVLIYNYKK